MATSCKTKQGESTQIQRAFFKKAMNIQYMKDADKVLLFKTLLRVKLKDSSVACFSSAK